MALKNGFPLFRLPLLAWNPVLELMTPFEILSLSLCSKRNKTICKSLRSQSKCREKAVRIQLKLSKQREIKLEFIHSPNIEWVLSIIQMSKVMEAEFLWKKNDLFITNWIPTEDDVAQERMRKYKSMMRQYMKVYMSEKDQTMDFQEHIDHLSDVFNTPLDHLELHYQDFTGKENGRIVGFYCRDGWKKPCVRSLSLVGETTNTEEDDEIVGFLLKQQEAKGELTLDIKPTSKFYFKDNQMRYRPNQLVIRNAAWLACCELEDLNSPSVQVYNSILSSFNFINLLQRWSRGWTPNWTVAMIDSSYVYLDDCINSGGVRNGRFELQRSEETIEHPEGISHRIRYCICRDDGTFGEFLEENNKFLHIKARDEAGLPLLCCKEHPERHPTFVQPKIAETE